MEVLIKKTKKIIKTIGWTILMVILMLVGFHIWFINNSERSIERLIAWRSNGKLRAKIKKFSIDYFNNNAEIKELTIFNSDTISRGTAYRFTTQELRFNIRSKWDLVFHKKLLIDSLIFSSPNIIITRKAHDSTAKKLALAEELGNVYNAINNSLTVLNLERFEINDGKVKVKDAGTLGKTRFELSHIFLSIDHLKIDSTNKNKHSFAFSDRVLLRVLKQKVKLPDDTSSISFNQLLIDSKLGIIEIENPAIKIYPPVGLQNKFIASASQLNITGLDFNTLYSQPLINIDSVFMQNPQGDLQLYRKDKSLRNKKQMPLDDALRNLPVAVNINHVVVQNGTVAVGLHQAGKTTVFDTKNDNLSVIGISLNDTAAKPFNIQGFNYIIRKYVGYTPDSIYRYQFDSLQFIDNRIILYNFNIATIKKVQSILIRNYSVPKFEITDMDWPSFIFNNHFKAHKAVLFNAVFNIEKNSDQNIKLTGKDGNKKSIYQTLSVMDNLLDLDELKVVNGEFNAKQGEDLNLHIGHLNWDINANELTEAKTFKQLIHSVKELSFDTATATNAALTLHISKSIFNNYNKQLLFNHILLNTNNQSITASLNNVAVSDFSFDNKELEVNEIHWDNGNIYIDRRNMSGNKIKQIDQKNYSFSLNNISGNNSLLSFENDNVQAQINIKRLYANNLSKLVGSSFQLKGLYLNGENALADFPNAQFECKEAVINDEGISTLKNVSFIRKTATDTVKLQLPIANFIPFINKAIASNNIVINNVELQEPQLYLTTATAVSKPDAIIHPIQLPAFHINGMDMTNATIHFAFGSETGKSIIDAKAISMHVQDILTQSDKNILFDKVNLSFNNILMNKDDDVFISSGNINILAEQFLFNPFAKNWKLNLNRLSVSDFTYSNAATQTNNLSLNKIEVGHINASNDDIDEGLPWLINKSNAFISLDKMHWQTKSTNFQLSNFLFDGAKKQVLIDSVSTDPNQSRTDFENKLIYRKAFIAANTGKIVIDRISYNGDSIHIPHIITNNAYLNIYSDNLKKAKAQTIKLLPVEALQKINIPLQIDTLQLNNMAINYTEINAVTKKMGTVNFNAINGNILNINTKPTQATDSLRLNIAAVFLDKLPLYFTMQSSYLDSLKGFALQLNVGRGDAKILNPVLEPFILLRAKSGFIDSMQMFAIANGSGDDDCDRGQADHRRSDGGDRRRWRRVDFAGANAGAAHR